MNSEYGELKDEQREELWLELKKIRPFDTARIWILDGQSLYSITVPYTDAIRDDVAISIDLLGSGRNIFKGNLTELIEMLVAHAEEYDAGSTK